MLPATLASLDLAVLALLALMALRGFRIGGVREACSLASLIGAVLLVRFFARPLGAFFQSHAPVEIAPWLAILFAGGLLGAGSLVLLGALGRVLRDFLRANNLGLLDRILGSLLGALEGALLVLVAVHIVVGVFSAEPVLLRGTQTLALYERAAAWWGEHGAQLKPEVPLQTGALDARASEEMEAALAAALRAASSGKANAQRAKAAAGAAGDALTERTAFCEQTPEVLAEKFERAELARGALFVQKLLVRGRRRR